MSIWYDGNDLNCYRGDSGSIIFKNLPCCEGYRIYFSVKSSKTDEIIVEESADVSFYYIDNEGNQQYPLPGETDEEFIQRTTKWKQCVNHVNPSLDERITFALLSTGKCKGGEIEEEEVGKIKLVEKKVW